MNTESKRLDWLLELVQLENVEITYETDKGEVTVAIVGREGIDLAMAIEAQAVEVELDRKELI